MINSGKYNRTKFAGHVGAALLISASATFTAEATVTAIPSHQQAGNVALVATVTPNFTPQVEKFGTWNAVISSDIAFESNSILAGKAVWEGTAHLQSVVYTLVEAEADFEVRTDFLIIPDAQFGVANWANTATFEVVPTKIGALQCALSGTATLTPPDSLVTRGAWADWVLGASSTLFVPTTVVDGVTYHHGHTYWAAGASFEEDPTKTVISVNLSFLTAGADLEALPTQKHAAKSSWGVAPNLFAGATNTRSVSANWSAGSTFTGEPTRVHPVTADWNARAITSIRSAVTRAGLWQVTQNAVFNVEPTKYTYVRGNWSATGKLSSLYGIRYAMVTGDWATTQTFDGMGVVFRMAEANWNGLATSLAMGAALRLVPAPDHRQIFVPLSPRSFEISGSTRTYHITPKSSASEVA